MQCCIISNAEVTMEATEHTKISQSIHHIFNLERYKGTYIMNILHDKDETICNSQMKPMTEQDFMKRSSFILN